MKKKVAEQIEKMQRKYGFEGKHSLAKKIDVRVKTQPDEYEDSRVDGVNDEKVDVSRVWQSECNELTKPKRSPNYERQNQSYMGKRYFDLSLFKAQSQCKNFTTKKLSLQLPKLKQNIQTDLYQETTPPLPLFFDDQSEIKRRALFRVSRIYAYEQRIVNQKYEKIQRIKNRLKIIDRIMEDKNKLKQEYNRIDVK